MLSNMNWDDTVIGLPEVLRNVDRSIDDGNPIAALELLWVLHAAPPQIVQEFETVSELELSAMADKAIGRLSAPDYGFVPDTRSSEALFMSAAVVLRALEKMLLNRNWAGIPSDPEDAWRVLSSRGAAFLIPMERKFSQPADDPALDKRPFLQRGLYQHRLIPCRIDGVDVNLKRVDWLPGPGSMKLSAALFNDVTFFEDKDASTFLVTGVESAHLPQAIARALEKGHADASMAVVFPELTMDDKSCEDAKAHLRRKAWQEKPDLDMTNYRTPAIVVAGSWHRPYDTGFGNVVPIYDGNGNPVAEQAKRNKYTDRDKLVERIVRGKTISIVVLDNCLVAFGVCLDFCNLRQSTIYEQLDVDFILVPSCGDLKTIEGHIDNAHAIAVAQKTRVMVVQQAYPWIGKKRGYILPPSQLVDRDGKKLATNRLYNVLLI